jgi:hypothetical protein
MTRVHPVPLRSAADPSFARCGRLVRDFAAEEVVIETWPAPGWRRVEPGTGNQGGVTAGEFVIYRDGDRVLAHNHAVGGRYVTGRFAGGRGDRVLVHEANYHPDGGQVVFPRGGAAFVALLAPPGDDVRPDDFVAFFGDGSFGIQIWPGVWHQPLFPLAPRAVFDDKQGRVHACIAVDFVREFGCHLEVPLYPG